MSSQIIVTTEGAPPRNHPRGGRQRRRHVRGDDVKRRHTEIIDALCAVDGVRRAGFRDALRQRSPDLLHACSERGYRLDIIPDAFWIDDETGVVLAFEVEVTSPLTEAKFERYSDLYWVLDEDYYSLHIVTVDRRGVGVLMHPWSFSVEVPDEDQELSAFRIERFAEWLSRLYENRGAVQIPRRLPSAAREMRQ